MNSSGLVRLVKEAYERIARVYRESRDRPWTWAFERLPHIYHETILDVGCGNSANTRYAVSKIPHRRYVACDVSYNMVKLLYEELSNALDAINCDARALPIRDSSVNLYMAIAVFHHLSNEDRELAYREAKRVLAKDGLMLVTVWGCKSKPCDRLIKWGWGLDMPTERYYHLFIDGELESEVSRHLKVVFSDKIRVGKRQNYLVLVKRD